jgi:hypothetical protein
MFASAPDGNVRIAVLALPSAQFDAASPERARTDVGKIFTGVSKVIRTNAHLVVMMLAAPANAATAAADPGTAGEASAFSYSSKLSTFAAA